MLEDVIKSKKLLIRINQWVQKKEMRLCVSFRGPTYQNIVLNCKKHTSNVTEIRNASYKFAWDPFFPIQKAEVYGNTIEY